MFWYLTIIIIFYLFFVKIQISAIHYLIVSNNYVKFFISYITIKLKLVTISHILYMSGTLLLPSWQFIIHKNIMEMIFALFINGYPRYTASLERAVGQKEKRKTNKQHIKNTIQKIFFHQFMREMSEAWNLILNLQNTPYSHNRESYTEWHESAWNMHTHTHTKNCP